MNSLDLKKDTEEKLQLLEINFRYWMGIAEVFAPIFIQSIPAALTLVSIGILFPSLLHIDPWFAWGIAAFVAIGMELLGLVSVDVYFASKTFNQTRADDEGKAPEGAALLVMMVYAVTALLIVVFLKMFPTLAIWSLIPLTLMSILIVSAVTMKKRLSELISAREQKNPYSVQTELHTIIAELQNRVAQQEQVAQDKEKTIAELQKTVAQSVANTQDAQSALLQMQNTVAQLQERMQELQRVQLQESVAQTRTAQSQKRVAQKGVVQKTSALQRIIDYLVQNYDGVATEEIDHAKVAEDLQIHRTTVTRNITKLQENEKLNGVVKKESLLL